MSSNTRVVECITTYDPRQDVIIKDVEILNLEPEKARWGAQYRMTLRIEYRVGKNPEVLTARLRDMVEAAEGHDTCPCCPHYPEDPPLVEVTRPHYERVKKKLYWATALENKKHRFTMRHRYGNIMEIE